MNPVRNKYVLNGRMIRAILLLASIILVGLGAGMVSLPFGCIAVGLLLWIDLVLWDIAEHGGPHE